MPHSQPQATGLFVGKNKGHIVKKRVLKPRPVSRKGRLNKRTALAREIAREVGGFAPYEKRIIELLKNNLDKRALRLAKKRLGSHSRALAKREEMAAVIRTAGRH